MDEGVSDRDDLLNGVSFMCGVIQAPNCDVASSPRHNTAQGGGWRFR